MEIDIEAEIKKKQAELLTLAGVLKQLNRQREMVADQIKECTGAINNLKAIEAEEGKKQEKG